MAAKRKKIKRTKRRKAAPEPTQKQRHDYVQKSLKVIDKNVREIVRLAFILGRDSIKQEIKAKF